MQGILKIYMLKHRKSFVRLKTQKVNDQFSNLKKCNQFVSNNEFYLNLKFH